MRSLAHVLAVTVFCGCGLDGETGGGSTGGGPSGSQTYAEIAFGTAGGCIVRRADGHVFCWPSGGASTSDASQAPTLNAVEIAALNGARGLSIGFQGCAIKNGGVV